MARLSLMCRATTTFTPAGELDEEALRLMYRRIVDQNIGLCLATGGAGEGYTLDKDELSRVYKTAVAVAGGKVQVLANPPEQHTARAMREHALIAVEAGVDVVNIYQSAGWHGFRPTDAEHIAYFDDVLSAVRHPVALAPLPLIGPIPSPMLVADLCRRYPQIVAVNLIGVSDDYFIDVRSSIPSNVDAYVTTRNSLTMFALGARGIIGAEMNIFPKTFRRYVELYEEGRIDDAGRAYADLLRIFRAISRWNETNSRWLKMAMKTFKLPGGEGGPRRPTLLPGPEEMQAFAQGLLKLGNPEIDELAKSAGL